MKRQNRQWPSHDENKADSDMLVVPLSGLDRTALPLAGGKAANVGELIQAGFHVPEGFCITTAAYERVVAHAGILAHLRALEETLHLNTANPSELSAVLRTALAETSLPPEVAEAITSAYQTLSAGTPVAVAVRSSATAEDLPSASFAGQQETFLNVVGTEAVLAAVQRCFASLWTDRAIAYRASLLMDQREVRLAVVVQRMVDAEAAGVLFTANPLTGKRREAVIDANPGLGEAVVSGVTNPDHFVVRTMTGEIIKRRLGEKQVVIQAKASGGTRQIEVRPSSTGACLSDEQIRALATLGAQVEARYGTPQDIEWAIDATSRIFLLQARPITTLFPLPASAPQTDEELHVYLAFGVQQGTYRPFTPLGRSSLRLLASGLLTLIGHAPADLLSGPSFVCEAASRPFFEVTTALRNPFGRRFLIAAMQEVEVHAATSFEQLITDPRLQLCPMRRLAFARALLLLFIRTHLPWYLLQALIAPQVATRRVQRVISKLRSHFQIETDASVHAHLAEAERRLTSCLQAVFRVSPVMLAGMQSFTLAQHLLGDLASEAECQRVLAGSPTNPTTQMNLALWKLSKLLQADEQSLHLLSTTTAWHLAQDYQQERLPAPLQEGMARFLEEYGHQSVNELDLGVPRWSENPTYVFDLLIGYVEMQGVTPSPFQQLQLTGGVASATIKQLSQRARKRSWLRGWLVRLFLNRAHALAGLREMTRFILGLLLAQARARLLRVGEALVQTGALREAADVFFLTFPEVHAVLAGSDLRAEISERRATFDQELKRRHVPLVLFSDGTEPASVPTSEQQGAILRGTPVSPGNVSARARVILEPEEAQLLRGEILVAPSTDPGWTPLFLKAAGLVMEVGGTMAHGAIVAREYGLPAVVGVAGATKLIPTGSLLTLDGSEGTIIIEAPLEGERRT